MHILITFKCTFKLHLNDTCMTYNRLYKLKDDCHVNVNAM